MLQAQRRKDVFPLDRRKAFELGARLAQDWPKTGPRRHVTARATVDQPRRLPFAPMTTFLHFLKAHRRDALLVPLLMAIEVVFYRSFFSKRSSATTGLSGIVSIHPSRCTGKSS